MSQANSIPKTQRAVVMVDKGKIAIQEVPVKEPKEGQVLVEVKASSINPVDWKILEYNFFNCPYPLVLGRDISGIVRAVGANVHNLKVGDEVLGNPLLNEDGSWASYIVLAANRTVIKPHKVSFLDAAALPVAALSAWEGVEEPKLQKGEVIYIPGGAGGVGHYAIQLAKIRGAVVISSGSRPDSIEFAKKMGADFVFDYTKQEPAEAVKSFNKGQLADVVYDAVYPKDFSPSASALKDGGRFVSLGNIPQPDTNAGKILAQKNAKVLVADLVRWSVPPGISQTQEKVAAPLSHLLKLIEEGKLKPALTKVVKKLDDLPAALEEFKNKPTSGKVGVDLSL